MTDVILCESEFDLRGVFTLTVPTLSLVASPISVNKGIGIKTSLSAIASNITVSPPKVGVKVAPAFTAVAAMDEEIARGDIRIELSLEVPSILVKAYPKVPDSKTIEFGAFKFSHANRDSPDTIAVDTDDRFARFGVKEPKIYTRKFSIIAESDDMAEYSQLQELFGERRTLSIFGFNFDEAYISNMSDIQFIGGCARWRWTVEFTAHVFTSTDVVTIDGWRLPIVINVGDEKKTPVIDEAYARKRINEPVAYTISQTVEFIDYFGECSTSLLARIGKVVTAQINGITNSGFKIVNITTYSPRGGGLIKIFVVELQKFEFTTTDIVKFGSIVLQNPTIPNSHDITPEYSVDMNSNFTSNLNPIPVITRRYAIECITESPATDFTPLVNAIGTKQTLIINSQTIPLCYISALSALQPRGGGRLNTNGTISQVWKYTIEFSKKSGEVPVTVTYGGILLPNAVAAGDEEVEIVTNRTILHDGRVAADLSTVKHKRYAFTCMSNSYSDYTALYNKIGSYNQLSVDTSVGSNAAGLEVCQKAYISSLSKVRKLGEPVTSGGVTTYPRLFIWTIAFEEADV